jgi:hypothetical protein
MLALACFVRQPFTTVDDVAHALRVPVAVAAMLVADLQAAGIEPVPVQQHGCHRPRPVAPPRPDALRAPPCRATA